METKKLKDCCTIIRGRTDNCSNDNTVNNSIPLVRPVDFEYLFPRTTKYTSQPIQIADKDDILMITEGEKVGTVNFARSKIAIGNGIIAIRLSSILHPFYVFCFLKSIESKLASMATGTALKRLSVDSIEDIDIPAPSLDEQKQLAEKLIQSASRIERLKADITQEKEFFNTLLENAFE